MGTVPGTSLHGTSNSTTSQLKPEGTLFGLEASTTVFQREFHHYSCFDRAPVGVGNIAGPAIMRSAAALGIAALSPLRFQAAAVQVPWPWC